jgi:hypothetical protein
MKVVQEENLSQVDHHMESRYQIEPMSCLFFMLGMLICAYVLHTFIFNLFNKKPAFAGFLCL